jgi:glycerol-3-phosphate acyltransferase PlsY
MAGAAAVIGHSFPVWIGFRGGRGVAVLIGTLYVLVTIPALIITVPVLLIVYFVHATTPALAFLFIVLIFLDWWRDVPGWVIF